MNSGKYNFAPFGVTLVLQNLLSLNNKMLIPLSKPCLRGLQFSSFLGMARDIYIIRELNFIL